jgi:hypothetical protein
MQQSGPTSLYIASVIDDSALHFIQQLGLTALHSTGCTASQCTQYTFPQYTLHATVVTHSYAHSTQQFCSTNPDYTRNRKASSHKKHEYCNQASQRIHNILHAAVAACFTLHATRRPQISTLHAASPPSKLHYTVHCMKQWSLALHVMHNILRLMCTFFSWRYLFVPKKINVTSMMGGGGGVLCSLSPTSRPKRKYSFCLLSSI